MKKILGLDLGTGSIGWGFVNEAENDNEKSSIIRLGVRVNPLTVDEMKNFEEGKSITTNADRTLKRSARRNLSRYKLRKENLIDVLKEKKFINNDTILREKGNKITFETYYLRAKATKEEITLEELSRVFLMINKKRGYKSSRKAKGNEEGQLIDGMDIAKKLYENNLTVGQYVLNLLKEGKLKSTPEFYNSDIQNELDKIWNYQKQFYPDILTDEFKEQIKNKNKTNTSKIFLAKYKIFIEDIKGTKEEKKIRAYQLRVDALTKEITKEQLAFVITEINGALSSSSNYLGKISDRSKELYFNKQTVGEYLATQLKDNHNISLKNQVFYRQDYLDEFEKIWETQKQFHKELTEELKKEIRDIVIFYQRRLKSQKGLISFCEFESKEIEVEIDGKKVKKIIGHKVCPKSSPLFQEFKIWQILNNIEVKDNENNVRGLNQEEKEILFNELSIKEKLSKQEALKLLFKNYKELDLNYKEIEGNETIAKLIKVCPCIANDESFRFDSKQDLENQLIFKLWHLLYSYEGDKSNTGDESLGLILENEFGFNKEDAKRLKNVTFNQDYGNLSTKAIKKILPYMEEGNKYAVACVYAGYRHSKESLTKEEIENKELKDHLDILPKNSLRNPVVEKILNQMVNVVNEIIDAYGKPDEIRIELARELKKNAQEREDLTKSINATTKLNEEYVEKIKKDFNRDYVSRNDIIRYKLYLELKENGFKTLYSNTYIPYEEIFSKKFDIEHIIPQSKLFDDSFSNKTLETKQINIEKSNQTALDYVATKYGEKGKEDYLNRVNDLFQKGVISKTKYRKLKMTINDIPNDFIERDLKDSQYIAKKAKQMLLSIVKIVTSTSGSITDRLREDWQLIDVMQELNWNKYDKLGLTEIIENKDGEKIYKIKDWTKRNDHRHHAMDALTIAFTKSSYIQYLNNLHAKSNKSSSIYAIEQKELYRNERGKLLFIPPIPLKEFREEAKIQLENILISIKAKNKVVTRNINITNKHGGNNKKVQLTPRGQLHLETIYGKTKHYITKEEKINASFNEEKINTVAKQSYREALLRRLQEFNGDSKKAFTGKNTLDKYPLLFGDKLQFSVPEKVKTVCFEEIYTIRKPISPDLKLDKVIDIKIRQILENRLKEYNNNANQAFSNLDENPIWLNKEKGISIKRVTITGVNNAIALHDKRDIDGKFILDKEGNKQPVDFVNTGNNHHVAIYRDEKGELQENVVSFFEATTRALNGNPIVDKTYNIDKGWQFLFTMKQNEYFLFPNETTGFNPKELSEDFIKNPMNYSILSPNLFRVQKLSSKNYVFNHHLETRAVNGDTLKNKLLSGLTYKFIQNTKPLEDIVKVRINHIGNIVSVGEY
jgi:CRISPR-associated endonuclease Csn1